MQAGQDVSFSLGGSDFRGRILKIYTEVGFEDHGKEFVVIYVYGTDLRFYEGEFRIEREKLTQIQI